MLHQGARVARNMNKNNGRGDIVINTQRRRRTVRLTLLLALGVVFFGASTAASYYVDALWFESLGLASVFWTRLNLEAATFAAFARRSRGPPCLILTMHDASGT